MDVKKKWGRKGGKGTQQSNKLVPMGQNLGNCRPRWKWDRRGKEWGAFCIGDEAKTFLEGAKKSG